MRELRRTRIAFVGDHERFAPWTLSTPAGGLVPEFVRDDLHDARERLAHARPHVIVVLDVDAVAPELYAGLGIPVLGVAAPDEERADRARRRPERGPWDRLVALDRRAATGHELWRLLAPPVDDALFAEPRRPAAPAHVVVAAPSTAYREELLIDAKHRHDLRHVAHGLTAATLAESPAQVDAAVVVRPHAEAGFDHGVALHAAAGHLVICDHTGHGLEPGTDVVLAPGARAIADAVGALRAAPTIHHRVRVRGRLKAERFRASHVWPALVGDLFADLEAFG